MDQQAPTNETEMLFRERLGGVLESLGDGIILYDDEDLRILIF